jgi:hypothetical protein
MSSIVSSLPWMDMKLRIRPQWLLLLAFPGACHEPANSRERVTSALRDSLGKAADPQVAFQKDSTHLLVQLATVAFPTMSEAALTDEARNIGAFAVRHYENANQLDSVTVLYREAAPRRGIWYIRHARTFPIGNLGNLR